MLTFRYKGYIIRYCQANYVAFAGDEVIASDDSWLALIKKL